MTLVGCTSGIAAAGVSDAGGERYSFDAAEPSTRRSNRPTDLRSTDDILSEGKRQNAQSNTRDLDRNYAIAQWAVNKHLDFVASFEFQGTSVVGGRHGKQKQASEDEVAQFNRDVEELIKRKSRKENCDVAGRHPLRRLLKISEAMAVLDGDLGWHKRRDGRVQLVGGDRVFNPRGARRDQGRGRELRQGFLVDGNLKTLSYAVHRRDANNRWQFQRAVPSRHMIWRGFYRAANQVRGNSPLLSGYELMQTTHETVNLGAAKMKMAQLLGYGIERERSFDDEDDVPTDENGKRYKKINLDKGPFQIELHPGDKLKVIESNAPGDQFVDVNRAATQIALKALDLPYSFFDEGYTNFFGSKQALHLYKRSAEDKQADNRDLLDELTQWWVVNAIVAGELTLPTGWSMEDVQWLWVPRGIPWWDKAKDLRGDLTAIAMGLDSFERVAREHGTGDPVDNIRANKRVMKVMQDEYAELGLEFEVGAMPRVMPIGSRSQSEANDD